MINTLSGTGITSNGLTGLPYVAVAYQQQAALGTGNATVRGRIVAYSVEVTNVSTFNTTGGYGYLGQMPPNADASGVGFGTAQLANLLIQRNALPMDTSMSVKNHWHWINGGTRDLEFELGPAPSSVWPEYAAAGALRADYSCPIFCVVQAPAGAVQTFHVRVIEHVEILGTPQGSGGPSVQGGARREHHCDHAPVVATALQKAQAASTSAAHSATPSGHRDFLDRVGHFFEHGVSDVVHDAKKLAGGGVGALIGGGLSLMTGRRPRVPELPPGHDSTLTIEELAEDAGESALIAL